MTPRSLAIPAATPPLEAQRTPRLATGNPRPLTKDAKKPRHSIPAQPTPIESLHGVIPALLQLVDVHLRLHVEGPNGDGSWLPVEVICDVDAPGRQRHCPRRHVFPKACPESRTAS